MCHWLMQLNHLPLRLTEWQPVVREVRDVLRKMRRRSLLRQINEKEKQWWRMPVRSRYFGYCWIYSRMLGLILISPIMMSLVTSGWLQVLSISPQYVSPFLGNSRGSSAALSWLVITVRPNQHIVLSWHNLRRCAPSHVSKTAEDLGIVTREATASHRQVHV